MYAKLKNALANELYVGTNWWKYPFTQITQRSFDWNGFVKILTKILVL